MPLSPSAFNPPVTVITSRPELEMESIDAFHTKIFENGYVKNIEAQCRKTSFGIFYLRFH
jgi:hypothetical protein